MPAPIIVKPDRRGGFRVEEQGDAVWYLDGREAVAYARWRAGFHEGCEVHVLNGEGARVIAAWEIAASVASRPGPAEPARGWHGY